MPRLTAELLPLSGLGEETRQAWQALGQAAVEPNPFFGPEMTLAAVTHLPHGGRARLLVVRRGDELELAMPLTRTRRYRRVPVPTFRVWGHDHTFLDTPLLGGRDPEGAWDAALVQLRRRGAGWLTFERLGADGPVRAALESALKHRGGTPPPLSSIDRPMVHRRPHPTYLDGRISSSQRRRLGRFRRRIEAVLDGPVWVADRALDDPAGAIDRFLALEQRGWKGRNGTALASIPGGAAYFRAAMTAAAARGQAQLWELGVGDTVLASLTAVVEGFGSFHLKTAYDEDYRNCSPGLQLEVEVLGAFHDDRRIDFIDSGVTGADETPSSKLYPDRRRVECLVVPLLGAPTQAAAVGLHRALAWRAERTERAERASGVSSAGAVS